MTHAIDPEQSQSLIERLPHREPMRLIHRIARVDANSATCETIANAAIAQLFAHPDGVDPLIGVELLAQSAAIPLIATQDADTTMAGMLVQVRNFTTHPIAIAVNSLLKTEVAIETLAESNFVIAKGTVTYDGGTVCQGTITLAVQK